MDAKPTLMPEKTLESPWGGGGGGGGALADDLKLC